MGVYVEDYKSAPGIVKYEQAHGRLALLVRGTFAHGPHVGHFDFLQRAKDLGLQRAKELGFDGCSEMVNVNNDEWVGQHKGEKAKKIFPADKRARLVAALDFVNYVFIHPSYDIHPAVALAIEAKPNIFVREDKDPEFQELEKKIFMEYLGYVPEYCPLVRSSHEVSTTEIIETVEGADSKKPNTTD